MDRRVNVWIQHFADRPNLMLQWLDPLTGKRRSRSSGTADSGEAECARADLEYELNHGLANDPARLAWKQFRTIFEAEYLPNVRIGTRAVYRATLDHFEAICRPAAIRAIGERTLSVFVAGLRQCPGKGGRLMAASTIQVRLQFLHAVLAWAAEQKLLARVPQFPTIKVPRKKPQPVPAESFERLLAKATDDQLRALLLCGWLAGLRLGEALALEWEESAIAPWLDLARGRIIFPAEGVKGGEDQWVGLDPDLCGALLALPRCGRKVFRFTNASSRPASESFVSRLVTDLAHRAGVKMSMRALRRGFGCYHAARVPAQVLQRLMRHGDIKTTIRFYCNVDDAAEEAIRSRPRNDPRNAASTPSPPTVAADGASPAPDQSSASGR